jgi:hypothetical protein
MLINPAGIHTLSNRDIHHQARRDDLNLVTLAEHAR